MEHAESAWALATCPCLSTPRAHLLKAASYLDERRENLRRQHEKLDRLDNFGVRGLIQPTGADTAHRC